MNINNLNLVELNAQEQRETEGGFLVPFLIAVAWSAWENVGDIRDGFSDGINNRKPRY